MDWSLTVTLIGLLLNFLGLVGGGIGFAWGLFRWLVAFRSDVLQRLAAVETEVRALRDYGWAPPPPQRQARRKEDH